MTFDKKFMKKANIFKILANFYSVAKYCFLVTLDNKMVVLWIITKIFGKKYFFLFSLYKPKTVEYALMETLWLKIKDTQFNHLQ